MNILFKVGNGVINYPLLNINAYRALTYTHLKSLTDKMNYELVIVESDGKIYDNIDIIQGIKAKCITALLCTGHHYENDISIAVKNELIIIDSVDDVANIVLDLFEIDIRKVYAIQNDDLIQSEINNTEDNESSVTEVSDTGTVNNDNNYSEEEYINASDIKYVDLIEKIGELEKIARQDKLSIDSKNRSISTLQKEIANYVGVVSGLNDKINELEGEIGKRESECNDSIEKIKQIEAEKNAVNEILNSTDTQINKVCIKLQNIWDSGYNRSDIKDANDYNISWLTKLVDTVINEESSLRYRGKEIKPFNYSGKAKIVPCVGSGSYGTTSIAMTIANRCVGFKTLFIDFDFVNAKADSWFRINPISKGLDDISNLLHKTATSVLLEKGTEYLFSRRDELIYIKETKDKYTKLEYMPGVYYKFDEDLLYSVNFAEFFNTLGDEYDFIIIDCGRIGSCNVYDKVIKLLMDIAYKIILVTLNDTFDTRSMSIKIDDIGIDRRKVLWLLNLSDNLKYNEQTKKSIDNTKVFIFQKILQLYGTKINFNDVSLLKNAAISMIKEITG